MYVKIEKDSPNTIKLKKKRPKNNSRFNIPSPARIDANKEYLLRLKKPVKIIQNVNSAENKEEYIKLNSNSKIERLGPHTAFNQNE
jgi:hypothetical protein